MDIEGLGERTVEALVSSGLVEDPADLYSLTEEQLLQLEGFAPISARNLVAAIDGSTTRGRCRGCSWRSASSTSARRRPKRWPAAFGTLDAIMAAGEADLATTEGVGPVIARSITAWFGEERNRQFVEKLRAAGVEFGNVAVSRLPQNLVGKASS